MKFGFTIGLLLAISAIGFTGGFYLAIALQKQIEVLIGAAIVLAFLTWLGSGADLLGLLREWYKEKREEEKKPTLEFDGIFVKDEHYIIGNKDVYQPTYYLRIRNKRVRGRAENCEGFLTVEGTDVNRNTVWDGNLTYIPISIQGDLKLFEIVQNPAGQRILLFRSNPTNSREDMLQNTISYSEELLDKQITIRIGASSGNLPSKPFITTIRRIIEQAQKE